MSARENVKEYAWEELREATGGWHQMCVVGEGGFGKVYRAMVHRTPVAIKVMDAEGLQGLQEFNNEAKLLARLQHPHIVKLLGTCRSGPSPCLVYELAPSGNLDDRLQCKGGADPMPWPVRLRILEQVAGAVAYLHGRTPPVVHRDLKPSNVFLDADLCAQLGDVGLAVAASSDGMVAEGSSAVDIIGDWAYLAPEIKGAGGEGRTRPRAQHSTRSDVYALGLILLQTVVGTASAQGLVQRAAVALETGDPLHLLDPTAGVWDPLVGERLLKLGSWSCLEAAEQRPSAATLHGELLRLVTSL